MAAKIKLLRSSTPGAVPVSLESGQIALNEHDGKLFWRDAVSGTVKGIDMTLALMATQAWVTSQIGASAASLIGQISTELAAYYTSSQVDAILSGRIASFNGRTGAVAPANNDYSFNQISGSPVFNQLTPLVAAAANYRAGTANKLLTPDQVWAAASPAGLATTGTVTPDFSAGIHFSLFQLTGNVTMAFPSNPKPGQCGIIAVSQTSSGGPFTVSWTTGNPGWIMPVAGAPAMTTTLGAWTLYSYFVINPTAVFVQKVS